MIVQAELVKVYTIQLDEDEEGALTGDEWFEFDTQANRKAYPTIFKLVDLLTDLI